MKKVGNLFFLAEQQLIKEKKDYSLSDIIEYAVLMRKWISHNPKKMNELMNLTRKEIRKRYYLRTKK
jgi:hypothetical protein